MNKYIKKQRKSLSFSIIFSALMALCAIIVQFLKGDLLDFAVVGQGGDALKYGILLLVFILLEIGLGYLFDYFRGRYSVEIKKELRQDFFTSLFEKSPPEIKNKQQGDIVAEYTNQIDLVSNNYFSTIPLIAQVLIRSIFVIVSLLILDWRVALITMVLLTTPLYVPSLAEKYLQKAQTENVEAFQTHLAKVVEWLSGFELIRNYSIENTIKSKFADSNDSLREKDFAMRNMTYIVRMISAILSYVSHFVMVAFSAWLVLRNQFTAGQFFVAISLMDQLSYPIISISSYLQEIIAAKPIAQKLMEDISYTGTEEEKIQLQEAVESVKYNAVDFRYESKTPVLEAFDLQAHFPQKLLIMGPSGSGKSTAMDLLLGYHVPQRGEVCINNLAVEDIADLGNYIAIMRQDPVLFSDTLRNNLTMYHAIDDELLLAMLKRVGLEKMSTQESLDQLIKEGGSNLSGGERRRISLARTLLRKAPIVILDEPLANLDKENVDKLEDLLLEINNSILFVITHQFSEEKQKKFDEIILL